MWRQTGGCDPKGPREAKQDKVGAAIIQGLDKHGAGLLQDSA